MLLCGHMSRILVSGSLAFDRIMNFPGEFKDHFLPEKLHSLSVSFGIDKVTEEFGGTAGNIAYSLSLLGIMPEILSTAGNDFDRYEKRFRSLGIPTETIAIRDDVPTATAYIMTDQENNQITAFAGGACEKSYDNDPMMSGASLLIVAPACTEDMTRMPELAKGASVPYFFDPGQRCTALPQKTIENGIDGSRAVFVNDYELALVTGMTGWTEHELAQKTGTLVVTLGERGSRLVTTEGETMVAAVSAKPIDPTGAGDAYRAGFIRGYSVGLPDETSAKIASTIAAFAVEAHGTQAHAPNIEDMRARYESAYGETWPL